MTMASTTARRLLSESCSRAADDRLTQAAGAVRRELGRATGALG
jgi:hypothetical protein